MKRSDLIYENGVINTKSKGINVHHFTMEGTKICEIIVEEQGEKLIGRGKGMYFTLFYGGDMKAALRAVLTRLIPKGKALVAGLGNKEICSDSLGAKALRYIPATAHLSVHEDFSALDMREVFVIETGVTGQTGIESKDRISYIARGAGADFIIAIDSLACAEADRLCRTIQVTDTGIAPGSGVGNNRSRIDSTSCGVPVIAIGVPTVIDMEAQGETLMVTPRNIDSATADFGRIIGLAVSSALNPSLTEEEILSLII